MNYTYVCHNCETIFIKIMTFEEFDKEKNKKSKCIHCGKKSATRVIQTSPTIEFKGSGFFSTDNPKENNNVK